MCWCTVLLKGVKVKLSPQVCKVIVLGIFVASMLKLQQFVINEPEKVGHQRRAAIQQVSAPVATSQFVLAAHMTSALHHD